MTNYFSFSLLLIVVAAATTQGASRKSLISPRIPPAGRIVGGETADRKDHPYVLSLEWLGYYPFCGASYLGTSNGRTYFLTACHCIEYDVPEELSLVAKNKTNDAVKGQRLQVSYIFINPSWDSYTLEYDACILESYDVPNDSEQLAPIPVCSFEDIETDKMATVLGWGALSESGSQSTSLQAVDVPIVDTEECNAKYSSLGWAIREDSMICAGYPEGGKDSCQGDSGGPIVTNKFEETEECLIGAVSWGYGCARPDYPGVYSYVVPMIDWIEEVMTTGSPTTTTSTTSTTSTTTSTTTTTEPPPTTTTTSTSTTTTEPSTTTEEVTLSTSTSTSTLPPSTSSSTHETNKPFETTEPPTTTTPTSAPTDQPATKEEESLWDRHRTAVVICICLLGALALAIPVAVVVALSRTLSKPHAVLITLPLAIAIFLAVILGLTLALQ